MARIVVLLLTVIVTVLLLLVSNIPLGVPDEWVWRRQQLPENLIEALDRLAIPVIVGAIVVAFGQFVDRRIEKSSKLVCAIYVTMLVVGAFSWLNAVRQSAATPHRELRPLWVLYDRFASGYFFEAAFHTSSATEMLAGYEQRMAKGDVLHEGTHPPGLFLLNFWAIRATERSDALATLAEWTIGTESVRLFRLMEAEVQTARPLTRGEFAALCLVSFLSTLLSAMTVIPVYGLVSRLLNRRAGWRAACVMLTIPSLAVFAPRSDIVYVFSATMILCLLVQSVVAESKFALSVFAVLAGMFVFVSLTVSLAHIPVLVAGSLFFLLVCAGPPPLRVPWQHVMLSGGVALAVFALAATIWNYATDCNLVRVWSWNLSNHAGFYKQSTRTWWKWFLVNPVELSFSIGLPLTLVYLESLARIARGLKAEPTTVMIRLALSLFATWAALWLSGKNMGEAARLWCFLTPWFVIGAAMRLAAGFSEERNDENRLLRNPGAIYDPYWLILLIAQMIVCTVTVGGVSGYQELTNLGG
ncbi:MAG: hypothetical protein U0936_09430 [Planctomycetaceae bacterium]